MGFKLVVFDLDGTLTDVDSIWGFLHRKLGTWSRARIHADMFYSGKIDYVEWARLDTALWKGVPYSRIVELVSEIGYVEGAYETVRELKEMGLRVGVISAGLKVVADKAMIDLGLDFAEANELVVRDGVLTGEIIVRVSHGEKHIVLDRVRRRYSAEMEECVAVGDDITNISLFNAVGLSIAYNPTCRGVVESADYVISDLRRVVSIVEEEAKRRRKHL